MPRPPSLELVVDGRRRTLEPTRRFVLGRGDGADLRLAHPMVSRCHAVLEPTSAGWTLTDLSRNGTFLDGQPVTGITLTGTTTLSLGAPPHGIRVTLVPAGTDTGTGTGTGREPERNGTAVQQGRLSEIHQVRAERITVGRLPDNDVVLDDLLVSRRHAELRRSAGGWRLVDLGSDNGTFVNGHRITSAVITAEDVIGIGHGLLQLQDDRLVTYLDSGDNTFQAQDLAVTTGDGRTLLHSVSFALPGRTLLAVIGPSGAGKSTLLAALVGSRPADVGEVCYAGRSLYADYDELRQRIALVPQDDVLHPQLTVEQALGYAARLRFPADTTPADRQRRIAEVLAELGLSGQAGQRIASLSGGQRKRTSVALELLTKPSLLFLDEPTSGLDPGKDRSVMHTLRDLADDGRTVVVATHNVANLEVCDRVLLLAPGGWLAYFGPPAEALDYFDQADFADIFLLLEHSSGERWAQRYRQSPLYQRYLGTPRHRPPGPPAPSPVPARPPRQQHPLSQLAVLCRRYLAVIAADRQYALFLAALPLVLSLLARAVPGSSGLSVSAAAAAGDSQPRQLLLVLVISAALMGAAVSIRELVKERPIYLRERAIGLSAGAYLASKVVVLGAVTGLQATGFTVLSLLGRSPPDDPLVLPTGHLEILVAVLGVTFTTMLIGLACSAMIDNADRGMPLLVLLVMVQLICCGGLFPVHDRPVLEQLAWLTPARWAFGAAAATTNLATTTNPAMAGAGADPVWSHSASNWLADTTALIGIAVALVALLTQQLARLDPQRRQAAPRS